MRACAYVRVQWCDFCKRAAQAPRREAAGGSYDFSDDDDGYNGEGKIPGGVSLLLLH